VVFHQTRPRQGLLLTLLQKKRKKKRGREEERKRGVKGHATRSPQCE
jgi:hypothetical protein